MLSEVVIAEPVGGTGVAALIGGADAERFVRSTAEAGCALKHVVITNRSQRERGDLSGLGQNYSGGLRDCADDTETFGIVAGKLIA